MPSWMSAVRRVVENAYVEADAPPDESTAVEPAEAEDAPSTQGVQPSDVKALRSPRAPRRTRHPDAPVSRPLRLTR